MVATPQRPARNHLAPASARYEPIPAFPLLPGPSTCSAWLSAALPLLGVSLFRRFRCYLDRPPVPHGSLPRLPLPGVSRFLRFRCYLNRPPVTHGSLPHLPLLGVSLFRRFRCYLGNLVCTPVRETSAGAWNIAVRTRGVFTHRTGFQKLACAERGLVRHGPTSPNPYDTKDGPVAYARHITSPATALVGAAEREQAGAHVSGNR